MKTGWGRRACLEAGALSISESERPGRGSRAVKGARCSGGGEGGRTGPAAAEEERRHRAPGDAGNGAGGRLQKESEERAVETEKKSEEPVNIARQRIGELVGVVKKKEEGMLRSKEKVGSADEPS